MLSRLRPELKKTHAPGGMDFYLDASLGQRAQEFKQRTSDTFTPFFCRIPLTDNRR